MIETMTEDLMNDMGSDLEISGIKLFAFTLHYEMLLLLFHIECCWEMNELVFVLVLWKKNVVLKEMKFEDFISCETDFLISVITRNFLKELFTYYVTY